MENNCVINAVVCGYNTVSYPFLKTLFTMDRLYSVCGYWDPTNSLSSFNLDLKQLEGSFDDVLKSPDYHVVFLCFAPQIQYKLLSAFLNQHRSVLREHTTSEFPIIVLLPPLSPCYDIPLLADSPNSVAIAMPFRKLTTASLLRCHLKYVSDPSSLNTLKISPSLPDHWTLGVLRSFHARLRVTSLIHPNQYSWLCEPGIIGGGLVNLYGAGLVDLAFHLTDGLRIASLTCVCRTFDSEVCSSPDSIRRINAEDYVLISAELETRSPDSRRPVAMFCISADLPHSSVPDGSSKPNEFALTLELTGSSGRFLIPPSGDTICWNEIKPVLATDPLNTLSHSGCAHNGLCDCIPTRNKMTENGTNGPFLNSISRNADVSTTVNLQSSQTKLLKFNGPISAIQLHEKGSEEMAVIFSESSVRNPMSSAKQPQSCLLSEAWTQWLSQLATSLSSSNTKQSLELLVASPEHWGYIQRVIKAIEKSARMRSWIDVATGERI